MWIERTAASRGGALGVVLFGEESAHGADGDNNGPYMSGAVGGAAPESKL